MQTKISITQFRNFAFIFCSNFFSKNSSHIASSEGYNSSMITTLCLPRLKEDYKFKNSFLSLRFCNSNFLRTLSSQTVKNPLKLFRHLFLFWQLFQCFITVFFLFLPRLEVFGSSSPFSGDSKFILEVFVEMVNSRSFFKSFNFSGELL